MDKALFIGLTVALTVYGQLIVKARALVFAPATAGGSKLDYLIAMYTDIGVLSGFVAGVIAAICWVLALEKAGLNFAYPFMALSFVFTPAAAHYFLGEALNPFQLIGLGLVVAGVTLNAAYA